MKKILIIDDSKTVVVMLRDILINNGYDVDFVHDGVSGYARVESYQPDLIILDLIMPGMDGLSCLHRIKESPKHKNIPVIILTSKTNMKDLFLNKDIIAFLEKPFEPEKLLQIIKSSIAP